MSHKFDDDDSLDPVGLPARISEQDFKDLDFELAMEEQDWGKMYALNKYTVKKPPLDFELEGKPVTIYGGSCHKPIVEDADVYVSLDVEQPVYYWEQPWYDHENKTHIRFPITDMSIPDDSQDFKYCIEHIQYLLTEGKKIHVGCIGGHGRTGMVLSALVQASMGDKLVDANGSPISAIDYVREHYAQKAVETVPQILFLHYNYGIAFPKDNIKEINEFLKEFKEEIGVSLDEVYEKVGDFDEVADVVKEIDNMLYTKKFARKSIGKNDFLNPPHLNKNTSIVSNNEISIKQNTSRKI